MTVEYLDAADYVAIAAEVTGLDVATVMKVANLDLADSALHAPAAVVLPTRSSSSCTARNGSVADVHTCSVQLPYSTALSND